MNIKEAQKAKEEMEKRIKLSIEKELRAFYDTTGLSVEDVSVYLIPTWQIGQNAPYHEVNSVEVGVKL